MPLNPYDAGGVGGDEPHGVDEAQDVLLDEHKYGVQQSGGGVVGDQDIGQVVGDEFECADVVVV
ncbi:MAG: hypothetical protein PVSMB5_24870 [Ktedonobacteraceae bacterium]